MLGRTTSPPAWPTALADAEPAVFWFDDPVAPERLPPLRTELRPDLLVVGGGYTGLWSALLAKERDPELDVVLVETGRCGDAASGRNGGFCSASLTHGFANGMARWPEEMPQLLRLGRENLDQIAAAVSRYDIDCAFEHTGELDVATAPYQVAELVEQAATMREYDLDPVFLDADEVRREVDSPTYLGGLWERHGTALVEPARLAWGLRRACLSLGVHIAESTPVTALEDGDNGRVRAVCSGGSVQSRRVVLATNAAPPLLRRLRLFTVPVYDYALATEPLSADRLDSIGWKNRQGLGDSGNQFHYYRLTRDDRIVWGGYDAVYHYGSGTGRQHEQRRATFVRLADHFFATFPQLEGLRFTHRWGGVIDTCTRFCAFYGTAMGGRVGYTLGFTGLGVGASRFAGEVVLDLLLRHDTERTRLRMVRERPVPFPPEPLRYLGIQATRRSLDHADRHEGRRNLWLRALDRLGMGYDS